jgi:hypothetical protein
MSSTKDQFSNNKDYIFILLNLAMKIQLSKHGVVQNLLFQLEQINKTKSEGGGQPNQLMSVLEPRIDQMCQPVGLLTVVSFSSH